MTGNGLIFRKSEDLAKIFEGINRLESQIVQSLIGI